MENLKKIDDGEFPYGKVTISGTREHRSIFTDVQEKKRGK